MNKFRSVTDITPDQTCVFEVSLKLDIFSTKEVNIKTWAMGASVGSWR